MDWSSRSGMRFKKSSQTKTLKLNFCDRMKSTPKTNPGTSKLWQVSSEIWPGNPFSGNKRQPPTICPSTMAPQQFSFLHPERILYYNSSTNNTEVSHWMFPYHRATVWRTSTCSSAPSLLLHWAHTDLQKLSAEQWKWKGEGGSGTATITNPKVPKTHIKQRLSPPKQTLEAWWEIFLT